MSEPCLSLPRLAKHFGVSRTTVFSAIVRGELRSFKLGNLHRIRLSDVPDHVASRWQRETCGGPRADLPAGPMVYFLQGAAGFVKIGFTTDVARRVYELQPGSPVRLELLAHIPGAGMKDERRLHRRFHKHRASGEWFSPAPEILAEIALLQERA